MLSGSGGPRPCGGPWRRTRPQLGRATLQATRRDEVWVADVNCIQTREGILSLASQTSSQKPSRRIARLRLLTELGRTAQDAPNRTLHGSRIRQGRQSAEERSTPPVTDWLTPEEGATRANCPGPNCSRVADVGSSARILTDCCDRESDPANETKLTTKATKRAGRLF
jgi:hypothetical protein